MKTCNDQINYNILYQEFVFRYAATFKRTAFLLFCNVVVAGFLLAAFKQLAFSMFILGVLILGLIVSEMKVNKN